MLLIHILSYINNSRVLVSQNSQKWVFIFSVILVK